MKTKLLKQIATLFVITTLLLTVGYSCKKDDPDPETPVTNPKFPTNLPDITFNANELDILTDFEKGEGITLHSHLFATFMAGSDGVNSELYGGFLSTSLDIVGGITAYEEGKKAYKDIKKDMAKITADIQKVEDEIAKLETDIENLIKEIQKDFAIEVDELELDGEFNTIDLKGADMEVLYGASIPNSSIQYFINKIDHILNHSPDVDSIMAKDSLSVIKQNLITHFATNDNMKEVQQIVSEIQTLLGVGSTTDVLNKTTDLYILKNPTPTPQTALNYYAYMEKRILKAFHHQLKGKIINNNIINAIGTTQDLEKWNSDFNTVIQSELQLLKDVTYRLVINSTKLTPEKYHSDMDYINYGLAPDKEFDNLLGRLAFTCSLIEADNDSLNNAFAGFVYTPYYYYKGGAAPAANPSINGNIVFGSGGSVNSFTMTTNKIALSQIPYTKWTTNGESVLEASPDNQWLFYNCEVADQTQDDLDGKFMCSLIFNDKQSDDPWIHVLGDDKTIPITAEVLWYDPNDPDVTTATPKKTKTNTMPFGFFAMRWLWGYQALSQGVIDKNMKYTTVADGRLAYPFAAQEPTSTNPSFIGFTPNTPNKFLTPIPNKILTKQCYNSIGIWMDATYSLVEGVSAPGVFTQFEQEFICDNGNLSSPGNPVLYYTANLQRQGSFRKPEGKNSVMTNDYVISSVNNGQVTTLFEVSRNDFMSSATDNTKVMVKDTLTSGLTINSKYFLEIAAYHWENGTTLSSSSDFQNASPLELKVDYTLQPIFKGTFDITSTK